MAFRKENICVASGFAGKKIYFEASPANIVKKEMDIFVKWNDILNKKDDLLRAVSAA